jgi:hypothetical protein
MSRNKTTLIGGRATSGVVRLGEAVRRPPTPNVGFVRALLRHLEAVGFDGAPRYLSSDESGREMYSYIPGVVPAELGEHDDKTLENTARLIRGVWAVLVYFVMSSRASSMSNAKLLNRQSTIWPRRTPTPVSPRGLFGIRFVHEMEAIRPINFILFIANVNACPSIAHEIGRLEDSSCGSIPKY